MEIINLTTTVVFAIICTDMFHILSLAGSTSTTTSSTPGLHNATNQTASLSKTQTTDAPTTEIVTTLDSKISSAQPETTREQQTTSVRATMAASTEGAKVTKAPVNCMITLRDEFRYCLESIGEAAIKYMDTMNLTGFMDDLCDPERSKPHVICAKRLFRECPAFLDRLEVKALQFGPYHVKDIHYFDTTDQMCRCSDGLVCINKLLEKKRKVNLTISDPGSPWMKMPNFKALCEHDTSRYIGCVRKNLRQCQTALNRRYGDDFTRDDAEDLKGMYTFIKNHCNHVNDTGFEDKYRCIDKASRSPAMHACVRRADSLKVDRKICEIRGCVRSVLEPECSDDMVSLYIDAVNVYTHSSTKLLNFPCSSASDIGVSIVTVIMTFLFVLYY